MTEYRIKRDTTENLHKLPISLQERPFCTNEACGAESIPLAAGFFLDEERTFLEQIACIVIERLYIYKALQKLDGIQPWRNDAYFIFLVAQ